MVILNSNKQERFSHLKFSHVVKVPRCGCAIVTARDRATGKTHVFLVANDQQKIYSRNGINNTWVELNSEEERIDLRQELEGAIQDEHLPCYSTDNRLDGL